ncbi:MAG: hypothetical protein Hals2KO_02680 [Halioglobus sp.]
MSTPGHAARINPENTLVTPGSNGYEIRERPSPLTNIFDFAPFTAHKQVQVPGFSDPLGTGTDPDFKVFSGAVKNLDLLGDFHRSNPFDPQELAPTQESLETSMVINQILYGVQIPGKKSLLESHLNVQKSDDSEFSPTPRTSETSPLVLAGFGSVSETAVPMRIHWTHCSDFTRYLYKKPGKNKKKNSRAKGRSRKPSSVCFMI